METYNYADTLDSLNDISRIWAEQFDQTPTLPLSFAVDAAGILTINENPFCPIALVEPTSIFIGTECVGFRTTTGVVCSIEVDWPYEGEPHPVLH